MNPVMLGKLQEEAEGLFQVPGMFQKGTLVLTFSPGGIQAGGEGAGCVAWL